MSAIGHKSLKGLSHAATAQSCLRIPNLAHTLYISQCVITGAQRPIPSHAFRFLSSRAAKAIPETPRYPQSRLNEQKSAKPPAATILIYRAPIRRIVFIGCLKVTTIFIFAANLLILLPSMFQTPEILFTQASLALALSAIPVAFVAWASAPFVTSISMQLPALARKSTTHLARFLDDIPSMTRVDVATIRADGRPRTRSLAFGDIRTCSKGIGIENYIARVSTSEGKCGKPVKMFIGDQVALGPQDKRWQRILEQVRMQG